MVANPFLGADAARRYARGRPDYVDLVVGAVRELTGIDRPIRRALDVGSGTGLSTRVLGSFARQVIGIEPSAHMVALAPALANATYLRASAEHIPLARSTCGLIGAGSALHWFDQAAFLAEIDRVATNDSHLVVFDHWFNGSVDGCPEFAEWFRTYLARYPSPPRDRSWSPPSDLGGWMFAGSQSYKHPVPMTVGRLTSYLLSQSNLQVMIDRGEIVEEQLRESLADELRAVITGDVAVVEFGGLVAHLRR